MEDGRRATVDTDKHMLTSLHGRRLSYVCTEDIPGSPSKASAARRRGYFDQNALTLDGICYIVQSKIAGRSVFELVS